MRYNPIFPRKSGCAFFDDITILKMLIPYFSAGITADVPAMNRKIPLWFVLLLLWFSFIGALAFGWAVWRVKTSRQGARTATDHAVIAIASSPSLLKAKHCRAKPAKHTGQP